MNNSIERIKLSFNVPEPGYNSGYEHSMMIAFSGSEIVFSIYYDFNDKPLELKGKAEANDKIEIVILPFRLELYINGALCDEEWNYGKCLYTPKSDTINGLEIEVVCDTYEAEEPPSVIGSFKNAEGWRPEENVFVGDCMPYVDDGRYHVLYLKDRHHHCSKWGFGAHQWSHISSADMKNWDIHPMAVEISDPAEGSICTGSWMKNDGKHYLFYTLRMTDGSPAPIKRSVSNDGYHFYKDADFSFTLSEKYHQSSARDPKVIKADDGTFHMFLTTSLVSVDKGCIAHLTSKDLDTWVEAPEPAFVADEKAQPECPDYIKFKGKYYLIFSLHTKAYYLVSDKPFSDWKKPDDNIIPCHSVPKGAVWDDRIVFTGFKPINGYAGDMTFRLADASDGGDLLFE